MEHNSSAIEHDPPDMEQRIRSLRRLYAAGLGFKPNRLQSLAMLKAARWSALAEASLLDPTASHNDRVRLEGCASRAVREMRALLDEAQSSNRPCLRQYAELMGMGK
jgi:hypothetical protein